MEAELNPSEKASQLPQAPGVYLMKDNRGAVVYVGKAKSLRARVRTYFQQPQDLSHKTRLLVSKIADIEAIVTTSEKEALILENSLIKKHRPRFNVQLRDDKEYPYLRLAVGESYPNLTIVRKPRRDGSLYFGPFTSAQAVRGTLKVIHKIFPLRKCSGKRLHRERPCIYHQLGQCPAPCCCRVPPEDYRQTVKDVQLFLQGRCGQIVTDMKQRMQQAAAELNFESAARLRDQISAIEKTLERQSVVCLDFCDRDVFAYCRRDATHMGITVLFVRGGRTIGSRNFYLNQLRLSDTETLSSFIAQYYDRGEFVPQEIIVPLEPEDQGVLEEWLREQRQERVDIIVPRRGVRKDLLQMAAQNAALVTERMQPAGQDPAAALAELQRRLHLGKYPHRIACFDISNISGTCAVGSMAVFEEGTPLKQAYRRYRIKTVHQPHDYAMMYEVLSRQLAAGLREGRLADLIVVDGGKGQLGVLLTALQENGCGGIDAAALAKARTDKQRTAKAEDRVFLPRRKNPVMFPKDSPAIQLLQRLRDEAHRFAVTYHRNLRKKDALTSPLETVNGIGKATVKAVLRHFGSLEKVRAASVDELAAVPAISRKRAERIYAFLHPQITDETL